MLLTSVLKLFYAVVRVYLFFIYILSVQVTRYLSNRCTEVVMNNQRFVYRPHLCVN